MCYHIILYRLYTELKMMQLNSCSTIHNGFVFKIRNNLGITSFLFNKINKSILLLKFNNKKYNFKVPSKFYCYDLYINRLIFIIFLFIGDPSAI